MNLQLALYYELGLEVSISKFKLLINLKDLPFLKYAREVTLLICYSSSISSQFLTSFQS